MTNFRLTLSKTFYGVGNFLTRDPLFIHFNKSDIETRSKITALGLWQTQRNSNKSWLVNHYEISIWNVSVKYGLTLRTSFASSPAQVIESMNMPSLEFFVVFLPSFLNLMSIYERSDSFSQCDLKDSKKSKFCFLKRNHKISVK